MMGEPDFDKMFRDIEIALATTNNCIVADLVDAKEDDTHWRINNTKEYKNLLKIKEIFMGFMSVDEANPTPPNFDFSSAGQSLASLQNGKSSIFREMLLINFNSLKEHIFTDLFDQQDFKEEDFKKITYTFHRENSVIKITISKREN